MKLSLTVLLWLPLAALAAKPGDYARGIELQAGDGQPMQELVLPDEVYAGVLRADLGDLRVFNADGTAVPHALCAPAVPQPVLRDVALAVIPLQAAAPAGDQGLRVDLHASSSEAGVEVIELHAAGGPGVRVMRRSGVSSSGALRPQAWVMDARAVELPLQAIRVGGQSSDGASEVQVQVEASEDLDRWQVVVGNTTLLRSGESAPLLERVRIALPLARYRYLRLERVDGGVPLRLVGVTAEVQEPPPPPVPLRFFASAQASTAPQTALYDAGRLAPLEYARLLLPVANMSLQVALESRATPATDEDPQWQPRWQGEVNSVAVDGVDPDALPIRFAPTADRYWRLRILGGAETLGAAQPQLELAYLPGRLRFLAQGRGPYTLAFGSARAEPATRACDRLLADVSEAERRGVSGVAYPASGAKELGGAEMLAPAPKPTPLRLILLWVTLAVGALALVAMALSLLRQIREPPPDAGA